MPNSKVAIIGGTLVVTIAIVSLLSNAGIFSAAKSTMTASDNINLNDDSSFNVYSSSAYDFSIEYPSRWIVDEGIQELSDASMEMLVDFYSPNNEADIVISRSGNLGISLVDYVKLNIDGLTDGSLANLNLLKEGGIVVNNHYGYFIEYNFYDTEAKNVQQSKFVAFQEADEFYHVSFMASMNEYYHSLKAFEHSLLTFKIQKEISYYSNNPVEYAQMPELIPYVDYLNGFSVSYPRDLRIHYSEGHEAGILVNFIENENYGGFAVIEARNRGNVDDFENYIQTAKTKSISAGNTIVGEGYFDVKDANAYYFEIIPPNESEVKEKLIILAKDSKAFDLMLITKSDFDSDDIRKYDESMQTFKFVSYVV